MPAQCKSLIKPVHAAIAITLLAACYCLRAVAQEAAPEPSAGAGAASATGAADENLAQLEARLAERFDRLELLVGRLAELSGSTQPRRATLLRQLIAESRDEDVAGQFDKVVAALEQESFSTAIDGQTSLEAELQKLLDLLLQEDRSRQIDSERKRIARYLQDLNRLIRLERGVKARTDGGDQPAELARDQQKVGDKTKELGDEIEKAEGKAKPASEQNSQGKPGANSKQGEGSEKQGDPQKGGDKDQPPKGDKSKPTEKGGDKGADKKSDKPKEGDKESKGESPSDPSEGQPSEGQPSAEQPSEGKPSSGKPSQGSPSQGSPSGSPEAQQDEPPEANPMQRAAQRLRRAQQRMEQAQKQLEKAKRDGALKEQEKAVEELEQAKAELERILRQLREEELERMLVALEARFRKMLDDQVEVYEETKRLETASAKVAAHELEIAAGRQARKEGLIVREADRALVLLREDGTSVAFPEAIEQARDDMQSISERLRETKVDLITQGLEEDVIAALEEALASLQQALKDLREQQAQQQQGEGEPGEQPLVKKLAELRMIRSLQLRVNRRTQQYGAMIEGEQATDADLLKGLDQLSLRQQKIFQATHDLDKDEK